MNKTFIIRRKEWKEQTIRTDLTNKLKVVEGLQQVFRFDQPRFYILRVQSQKVLVYFYFCL